MKRSVKVLVLLLLVGVFAGGYAYVNYRQAKVSETAAAAETEGTVALAPHTSDEVTALSWTTDDGEIRFVKDGETWSLASDGTVPVNSYSLDSQADLVTQLTAIRTIDNVEDRSVYGLSEPAFTITAEWSDGTSTTFSQGSETTFADGYYLGRSGDERVYIVEDELSETFGRTLKSLIVKETIPTAEKVTRVTTANVDALKEDKSRSVNTDLVWYDAAGTALDPTAVQTLSDAIAALKWSDLVKGSATEEELAGYGLADGAVTLCLYDGDTAARTILIGNEDGNGSRYARLPASNLVYTIASDDLADILAATDASLAAGDVLLTLPYKDVASADITADTVQYALETIDKRPVEEEADEETAESADAAQDTAENAAGTEATEDPTADDEVLWELVNAVTSNGAAENAGGETVLTVRVTNVNGVSGTLTVAEYDADSYAASLDGGTQVLVSADRVDKIIRMAKQMAK